MTAYWRRTKDGSNPLQMPEQKQKPKTRRESLASNHRLIVDEGRQVASDNGENEAARVHALRICYVIILPSVTPGWAIAGPAGLRQ